MRLPIRRPAHRRASPPLCVLGTTGCGSDDTGTDAGADDRHGDAGMTMNDPDATPADEVDGDVDTGTFTVLDTAPPGSDASPARPGSPRTTTVRR